MSSGLSLCSMEWIGIIASIASIIAAIAAVATLRYTKRNSRGNIRRRIAAKERQISDIQNQIYRRYGLNDNGTGRALSPLDMKKRKLQEEIEDLRLEL